MSPRFARRLAWFLWVVTTVIAVVDVTLLIASGFAWPANAWGFPGFSVMITFPFAVVGALVVSQRPTNTIGWIFLALGLCGAVQEFVMLYGVIAFSEPVSALPGATYAAWVANWIAVLPTGGAVIFLFLLFPHGRLPGRRWLPVAVLGAVGMVVAVIGSAFVPGPMETFPTVDNPLGLLASRDTANVLSATGWGTAGLAGLLAIISLALRWRRAVGHERQPYKWLVAAGTIVAAGLSLQWFVPNPLLAEVGAIVGFVTVPIAVGIAILRYRLYDIDRLISRTVTYAIVVGTLAIVYAAGVFLLSSLLPTSSDLAVAASTLAAAALFSPLLRRVQGRVDRQFNRPRYDAAVEVQHFASRVRTHVDLDALTDDLSTVVSKTMHPSTASVWLR